MNSVNLAWIALALHGVLSLISVTHALVYKRDPRAALGWIAVCIAYPIIGPLFYYLFGINRVKTRARKLKGAPDVPLFGSERAEFEEFTDFLSSPYPPSSLHIDPKLHPLARASFAVTRRPLLSGNMINAFFTGESAYKCMLEAIETAHSHISLSTYIFDTDQTGQRFIGALGRAKNRGVEVQVLLDGVGEKYSFPSAGRLLKKQNINVARYTPPTLIPPGVHINLRNHRKLLLVDGLLGFTGGMNIGDKHLSLKPNGKAGIKDIHFQLQGNITQQLQEAFDEDWSFATGDKTTRPSATQPSNSTNKLNSSNQNNSANHTGAVCRVITDGPNEDLGKLSTVITSAAAAAQNHILIMTPYFLPLPSIVSALQIASLRGVSVTIVLPGKNNQPLVHWATQNMLWELLQTGVRVYYQPGPFDHSKCLIVDDCYALIGSANLDPRSLRLNFELNVEIYDKPLVKILSHHFELLRQQATEKTLRQVDSRPFLIRIRDAIAWLFSPYL